MTVDLVKNTVSRTHKLFDNNAINTIGHWIMHLNKYLINNEIHEIGIERLLMKAREYFCNCFMVT